MDTYRIAIPCPGRAPMRPGTNTLTLQKVGLQTTRHSSRQECLPRPGRTIKKHALGRLYPDALEELWVLERQLYHFPQFPDLVIQAANACEADLSWVFERHVVDKWINFPGKHTHYCEGCHVEGHTRALF